MAAELAKEVELTGVPIFPIHGLSSDHTWPRGEAFDRRLTKPPERCGVAVLTRRGTRSSRRQCRSFFGAHQHPPWRCPTVYCNQHSRSLRFCTNTVVISFHFWPLFPSRPSTLRTFFFCGGSTSALERRLSALAGSCSRCCDRLHW